MSNKTIAIVGAGSGVSSGIARKFGSNGFKVILIARNEKSLAEHVRTLEAQNIEVYGIAADAAAPASLQKAFDHLKRDYGIPDVLVYNAAVTKPGTASMLREAELLEDLNVNVVGALSSALQVIPDFVERKSGTILLTGGGFALHPSYEMASLSIGKAALRSLAYTLGDELAPFGIHVGTITIAGTVAANTNFDPNRIAEAYWDMYEKRIERECIYQ